MRGIFAEHEHAKFFALISDYRLQWYKELGTPCSTTPADPLDIYHRFKIIRIRLFVLMNPDPVTEYLRHPHVNCSKTRVGPGLITSICG